jgi:type I restriction enzyme S subunit
MAGSRDPELPWPAAAVGRLFYVKGRIGWRGLRHADFTSDGPFLITGMHIDDGGVSWKDCFHVPQRKFEESPEIIAREGDLVITKDGTIGKVAFLDHLPGPTTLNAHLFLVRPLNEGTTSRRFAFHVFRSSSFEQFVESQRSGSTISGLGEAKFVRFPFPTPTLSEQRDIANILDTLDDAIRRTEQVIVKLQQMKQGVLHDLLTRGVDEHGALRPAPDDAPCLYQNSPIGPIPKDWQLSSVADEFSLQAGVTLGPHRAPKRFPFPYLRVANVFHRRLELLDIATLEARPDEVASRLIAPGDLLVVEGHANVGEIGRAAMADQRVAGLTFQNHLFRLRPHRLMPVFAEAWMNGDSVRGYWRRMCATSSGLNTINQSLLRAVDVAVPTEAEQQRICTVVWNQDAREADENGALRKLIALKHGLQHDLLTGRVRVPLPVGASA